MGHERVGTLPKTKKWRSIVVSIGEYSGQTDAIKDIASQTTKNVKHRFNYIESDGGVFAAFKYVVTLAFASKREDAFATLHKQGIELPDDFSLYDLAYSVQEYIAQNSESKEYSSFASQSIVETIGDWARTRQTNQLALFDSNNKGLELWQHASNGAGFCELSRLFFSKFTERYLKYFLEREAAASISNIYDRKKFNENLERHVDEISQHAFETSKITQSFAAGWFNKEARDKIPSDRKIKGFLSFAFKKINSELTRENHE